MNLFPLLLAWMLGQKGSGGVRSRPTSAPLWPTTVSPPPVPAFYPQTAMPGVPEPPHAPHEPSPAPPQPSAETATPLATLLHAPPKPPPTHAAPSKAVYRHTRAPASVKKAVTKAPASLLHRAAAKIPQPAVHLTSAHKSKPKTTLRQAVVSDLQQIMISRGARITRDGLYGPKTAGAWSELAHKKGLPPDIKRVNAKIASVSSVTYDALSVPPIP